LENSSVGTSDHLRRDPQAHRLQARCQVIGTRIRNLCKIGNCILMSGAVLSDGCVRLNL